MITKNNEREGEIVREKSKQKVIIIEIRASSSTSSSAFAFASAPLPLLFRNVLLLWRSLRSVLGCHFNTVHLATYDLGRASKNSIETMKTFVQERF